MEKWIDIRGFEGYYQVSNTGNVKSLTRKVKTLKGRVNVRKGKEVAKGIHPKGYVIVKLSKEGKQVTATVHSLVANAFIENPLSKPQVNHKDGNKKNNMVNNLEWNTHLENHDHAIRTGLLVQSLPRKIMLTNIISGEVKKFKSIAEAERNGFHKNGIKKCLKGEYKSHKGYLVQNI